MVSTAGSHDAHISPGPGRGVLPTLTHPGLMLLRSTVMNGTARICT